jgi:hypothetical protein
MSWLKGGPKQLFANNFITYFGTLSELVSRFTTIENAQRTLISLDQVHNKQLSNSERVKVKGEIMDLAIYVYPNERQSELEQDQRFHRVIIEFYQLWIDFAQIPVLCGVRRDILDALWERLTLDAQVSRISEIGFLVCVAFFPSPNHECDEKSSDE